MEFLILLLGLFILGLLIMPFIAFGKASTVEQRLKVIEAAFSQLKDDFRTLSEHGLRDQNIILPSQEAQPSVILSPDALIFSSPTEEPEQNKDPVSEQKEDEISGSLVPAIIHTEQAQQEKSDTRQDGPPPHPYQSEKKTKARAARSMEETLGTQWTVWIGGIALAFGVMFLVKYSIDQGIFGPGVRMIMAALFSFCLLGAGEYLRRKESLQQQKEYSTAHIPGILTAVGIIALFATILASYSLYGFIGPTTAFIFMALCSLLGLFAAALHGPALAALGLLGSFVTPLLVNTGSHNTWGLFGYLAFVSAVTYGLAYLRRTMWIAVGATLGSVGWALLWMACLWRLQDALPIGLFLIAMMGVAYVFLNRPSFSTLPDNRSLASLLHTQDFQVVSILGALAITLLPLIRMDAYSDLSVLFLTIAVGGLLGMAWRSPQLSSLCLVAGGLFCAAYMTWHIPAFVHSVDGPTQPDLNTMPMLMAPFAEPSLSKFLSLGAGFGALFIISGMLASLKRDGHKFWTITSASIPVALFAFAYWKATNFTHSVPFGLVGFALTGLYIWATDYFYGQEKSNSPEQERQDIWAWSSGIYAASAVSTLALAATMLLEKGWLTVALSTITLGLAWVTTKRPVPALRYLAGAIVALVAARLVYEPTIVGSDLGTTPVLNWLLYGYALPAAIFICSANILRKAKDDWVVQLLEAAAILFVVVFISLEIHHYMNNGNMYVHSSSLAEQSLHTLSWLGVALGLQRLNRTRKRPVFQIASNLLGIIGFISIVLGHMLTWNPLFTGEALGGGLLFNPLMLAYAFPGLLCALVAITGENTRPIEYLRTAGITALTLIFTYLSLEIRRIYQGPILAGGLTTNAEWYTYSAVWLAYGIILLTLGIWTKRIVMRYASLTVIMLTILKVFLFDMANLTGLYRALSFIGLGLVLVVIGGFYQAFVFPGKTVPTTGEEQQD